MSSPLASAAAQLQAIQRAIQARSKGSGWSLTNRSEQRVLAQQALRMSRAAGTLLRLLIETGTLHAHANGTIRTDPQDPHHDYR